jgi:hypothetical protein
LRKSKPKSSGRDLKIFVRAECERLRQFLTAAATAFTPIAIAARGNRIPLMKKPHRTRPQKIYRLADWDTFRRV